MSFFRLVTVFAAFSSLIFLLIQQSTLRDTRQAIWAKFETEKEHELYKESGTNTLKQPPQNREAFHNEKNNDIEKRQQLHRLVPNDENTSVHNRKQRGRPLLRKKRSSFRNHAVGESIRFSPQRSYYKNQTCMGDADSLPDANSWQKRAPHVVLIGAMKAGTEALSYYLRQHPQIPQVNHKEGRFFDLKFDNPTFYTPDGTGILQGRARNAYCNYIKGEITSRFRDGDLQTNENLYMLEDSPRYLFWSDIVPRRLLCVAPWVKLVVLLRNPVDRAFSHYTMETSYEHENTPSFEQRVQQDFQRLKDHGLLLEPNNATNSIDDAQELLNAWKLYTRGPHDALRHLSPKSVLGRGLYALQLQHWFHAMDEIGKPRSDLLIIQSEEMRTNTQGVVNRILDFCGLPRYNVSHLDEQHLGNYKTTMNTTTRQELEEFFEPYNQQLYKLLGWEAVWDPKSPKERTDT